jgi:micrococcal nuclease
VFFPVSTASYRAKRNRSRRFVNRFRTWAFLTVGLWLMAAPACGQISDGGDAPATEPDATEPQFVASASGTVYYWRGCDNWRSIPAANRRWFATAAEAEAAGYQPSTARGCADPDARSRPGPAETGTCTVRQVVDGDTVVCAEASERIRLLLIDGPELAQGEAGELARRHLESLLPPGTVAIVETDVQPRDNFDRLLAYLYTPSGELVNEAMARAGFATLIVYQPNVKYRERIREAEAEARRERRGLWATGAFECAPVDFRANRCR